MLVVVATHCMECTQGEHGTGSTNGVAQSDRATIWVSLLHRQPGISDDGQRLGGKRFIEFNVTDISWAESGFIPHRVQCMCGRIPHKVGIHGSLCYVFQRLQHTVTLGGRYFSGDRKSTRL